MPRPGVDCTSISPSCSCTVRKTSDSPMPLPCALVVKYRSKMRDEVFGRDADARVFDLDGDQAARRGARADPQASRRRASPDTR